MAMSSGSAMELNKTILFQHFTQLLFLNTTTRRIITISAIVKPTHTPALNIFPIASHELNNTAANTNKNGVLIFDIALSLNS